MARRMVNDDAEIYRVLILRKKWERNPDYDWRSEELRKNPPYLYSETERVSEFWGPYNSLSAAKGQRTSYMLNGVGELREGVISASIQKAQIVWEEAEEGGS
ncbi:hypothetical protein OG897_08620 [Streptomyces sp. NBC_00237]|uniref:hypothetical protein n=1 Tax=Streptomyces sp. NBC_00237 TaxID=2975687 RepID=UPI00224E895F|nr:hypothetical protein [Streptomyces sp. NBC_00237]MCX5201513.1 hypothetical protein [Streptomyces sp. NBC_00237]